MFIDVFTNHWGYASASYSEVRTRFGVKELKWIINPRLFLFAEIDNQIAGFRLAMPNYNQVFKKLNGNYLVLYF